MQIFIMIETSGLRCSESLAIPHSPLPSSPLPFPLQVQIPGIISKSDHQTQKYDGRQDDTSIQHSFSLETLLIFIVFMPNKKKLKVEIKMKICYLK